MKIKVGSENSVKVEAVREIISDYPQFRGAAVFGIAADSEVGGQPRSLEELVRGAVNRARNAFLDCDLSFGIESGLMAVPRTKTGYMDVCAAVYLTEMNIIWGFLPHLSRQKMLWIMLKKVWTLTRRLIRRG